MDNYAGKIKSMYDEDPILKQFEHVGHRRSIVDLYPSESDEPDFEIRGNILSRRNSAVIGALSRRNSALPSLASFHNNPASSASIQSQSGGVDALDQVAAVASHHDSLYSYHYMDETDKR